MNPQETQQVAARDEKWVPFAERVKISSTNIRLETTVPQKEETFQVIIDGTKNSTCFKAFTISVDVLKIFMQQFWTILDIYPRVKGVDFADVPDDDTALTFLIDLGYKGPLNRHTNMFMDHMHQPWRTLAAIINKCLSGKTASNDKLRKSRIDILWGMFNRENVDYPELIWEDLSCQIDHRKEKRSRQSYQMFIKYSTGLIPPKKSRGKGSKGKKAGDESQEAIDISKESEPDLNQLGRKLLAEHYGRSSKSVVIQDTLTAPKSKPSTSKTKLKGAPSLTLNEQEAANIMQVLKERVPDESRVVSATSSEETGTKPRVLDEDKDITEETVILEWGDEQDSEYSDDDNDDAEKDEKDGDADDEGDDHVRDTQDADDEDVETESDEDDIYKYKIRMCKDEDEEMKDAEVKGSDKVIPETTNLPPIPEIIPETPVTTTNLHLKVAKLEKDVFELKTGGHSSVALAVLQSYVPTVVDSYLDTKVEDVFEKELQRHLIDLIHKYSLQHLPKLTKKLTPKAEQESEKSPSEILKIKLEQAESQKNPQFTIKSINKAALEEYDLKSALYQSMHANKSFNRNSANHRLYHELKEALIEDENAMDKGVADIVKDHKRKHDDDEDDDNEDPPAGPTQVMCHRVGVIL
ncbi:hypothetical protein Tco_0590820 [Tanacetum coccineum]